MLSFAHAPAAMPASAPVASAASVPGTGRSSPRGRPTEMSQILGGGSIAPSEAECGSPRRAGLTLTTGGWSSKRTERKRNVSPGISILMGGKENVEGEAQPAAKARGEPAGGSRRRRSPVINRSTAVGSLLKPDAADASDAADAASVVAASETSWAPSRRSGSPSHYHYQRSLVSDSVRHLMRDPAPREAEEARPPWNPRVRAMSPRNTSPWDHDDAPAASIAAAAGAGGAPAAGGAGRASDLNALFGQAMRSSKVVDVARSALESNELRIAAERLHLRDFDMHTSFLGSGFQSHMAPTFSSRKSGRAQERDQPAVAERAVQQCRGEVDRAVAALFEGSRSGTGGCPMDETFCAKGRAVAPAPYGYMPPGYSARCGA